jgi:hypothetical protein
VGRVQVDHGRVVVCDPVYAALSERDEEAIASCDDVTLLDFDEAGRDGMPDHLGVAVGSGWATATTRSTSSAVLTPSMERR